MNISPGILAVPSGELVDAAVKFVSTQGVDFAVNVVSALAIFFVGRFVARLSTRLVEKLTTKAKLDKMLVGFIGNLTYFLLLALVTIAALEQLGVDTTSFAALIAATGLAVGLALQGSLSNFAAGVLLILFKPFQLGDFVEAGGSSGVIEEIHIFHTIMRTGDNVQIVVPNSAISAGTITNFSAKETRRIDLTIGCGYDDDLKAVKEFLMELVTGDERVLTDPEPVVSVAELGDSSVNFVVRPWVNSEDYWATRWDLTEAIKLGFDEQGFNIPYPTRALHVHNVA